MMARRLRRIRVARGKSQEVIAGLAGITKGYLSMLETGERPLDSLKLIVALAGALGISPSELTQMPVPAPGDGTIDAATEAVRHALAAVDVDRPGGDLMPVEVLRVRVAQMQEARRGCRFGEVGNELPGLIRDLHISIDTGQHLAELLPLAVLVHVDVTRLWLKDAGSAEDLRRQVTFLARSLAQQHGDATLLAAAGFGAVTALLAGGMLDLARAELESITPPAVTPQTAGLVGALTMAHSVLAVVDDRPGEVAAPMDAAAELAARFGEIGEQPFGFGFGPTNVGLQWMTLALEAGDHDRAAHLAEGVQPDRHPHLTRQVTYWVDYGRALSRLRGRRDDAVRALRTAEDLSPVRVYRNPIARDVITELAERPPAGRTGEELRGLAYRAGLPE
jgi:transcriptional regulator with XRE-family HTH domain